MKSCSKKILIDMIKPKKNTMHLLCRLTPYRRGRYIVRGDLFLQKPPLAHFVAAPPQPATPYPGLRVGFWCGSARRRFFFGSISKRQRKPAISMRRVSGSRFWFSYFQNGRTRNPLPESGIRRGGLRLDPTCRQGDRRSFCVSSIYNPFLSGKKNIW